jgi:hypothetical protein
MNPPGFYWFSLFPLNASVFGLVKSLPPIFYEVVRLFPKMMASNELFGIAIQKESDIIANICLGRTITEETRKNLGTVTARYIVLQEHYASYMIFCLVDENAQNHLLTTAKVLQVVLVQCLWFIENGERFSPNNALTDEKNIIESNHNLGFMGYGIDDFMSKEKNRIPIFD